MSDEQVYNTGATGWIAPRTLIAGGIVLLLFVVMVVAVRTTFTAENPGMNDFMSRWEGARSFFEEGVSPYSEQASLNIQERIYGRPVIENEDPGFFVYPFYTVFVVGPTVPFEYSWASAIWMVLLIACLVGGLFLLLSLYRWRPPPLVLGGLLLWALLDYFASRGLILGQPSHLVYLLQVLTLWALFRRYDTAAGVALAISTLKPQMGYLLVPFLLLWGLRGRRLQFVGALGVTFAGLMAASFALQPDWFGAWIDQVQLYPEYTSAAYPDTGSPVWIITQHYLGLGDTGEWVVNLAFILPMLWAWYTVLVENRCERLLWAVVVTLVVTHLVALRTATPHFVVFNIVIIFYLKWLQRKRGATLAVLAFLFVFSWAHFLITVQGRNSLEHPSLFLPLPLVTFALIWLTRRLWWSDFAPTMPAEPVLEQAHA
jgi:hypothetical protein